MASIIIHLTVTQKVLDICEIKTCRNEYFFGNILPDYTVNENHHYKDIFGERKFFNLTRFRKENEDKLDDPVYLGYYLHLVQDVIFRDFMYNLHGFSSAQKENVLKLYRDYGHLNGYLADNYQIPLEILKNTDSIPAERYSDFSFNKDELEEETEKYHNVNIRPEGEYSFFTPEMADDYIRRAEDACVHELSALKGEKEHIDESAYSWSKRFD